MLRHISVMRMADIIRGDAVGIRSVSHRTRERLQGFLSYKLNALARFLRIIMLMDESDGVERQIRLCRNQDWYTFYGLLLFYVIVEFFVKMFTRGAYDFVNGGAEIHPASPIFFGPKRS